MNDIELRAECIRIASDNLGVLASNTALVIEEAQKLFNYIWQDPKAYPPSDKAA